MATADTFRRGILPRASDEEINALLWNCSPFPFLGDVRKLRRSIRRCLRGGGGTVEGAIAYSEAELDRAMAQREKEREQDEEGTEAGRVGAVVPPAVQ